MIKHTLNINSPARTLDRYWEFCVGSCHATTALREDYREMLRRCRRELGFRYLRFHGLFNDDMSVVSKPMFSNKLVFSFANIDNIFDFLLSIDMKPLVELSFMPEALASSDSTIFHYKANTSPPKDYEQWADFIETFTEHLISRYGRAEVRSWFFEVWNEPNLGGKGSPYGFWSGSKEEYFKLYDVTARALKRRDPFLRVGGPVTSNNAWIPEFLDFCKNSGAPVDFVSTHSYPTDVVLGYGVEDSANFANPLPMDDTERIRDIIEMAKAGGEEFEQFKKEYSVFKSQLWEHVDRGVLTDMTRRAVAEAAPLPLFYTEWGSLGGMASDSSFGASFIAKTVLDNVEMVKCYSFWTFCDIIEENAQDSSEFFGGFGLMTQHGVAKAPYRAFQLLHMLEGELYDNVCREGTVDIYAVRNREINAVQLIAVNHHSLMHDIKEQKIEFCLNGADSVLGADIIRVDDKNANACEKWLEEGGRKYLSKSELLALQCASELRREELETAADDGAALIKFTLPPMGMALINIYLN